MRHRCRRKIPGKSSAHRRSLLRNLATSLFLHGQIETTLAKAKALRPYAEKIITKSKSASLAGTFDRRMSLYRDIRTEISHGDAFLCLTRVWARHLKYRQGGYLRIVKLGKRRSDSAEMAIVQMVLDKIQHDGSIVTLANRSFSDYFKEISNEYLNDIDHNRKRYLQFSSIDLPVVSIENQKTDNKNILFDIFFKNDDRLNLEKWPTYKNKRVTLPLTVSLLLDEDKFSEIDIKPSPSIKTVGLCDGPSRAKMLYDPDSINQYFSIKLSSKESIRNSGYLSLIAQAPFCEICNFDLLKRVKRYD